MAGILFRDRGNAVNPRIGSGLQYGRRVEEEKTVEVVQNHEGGTRVGTGVPTSKEAPCAAETRSTASRQRGAARLRESDSSIRYDGGAIFGQPQERKPGFAAGSQGLERVGKQAPRSGGSREPSTKVVVSGPVEGPRGPKHGDVLQGRGGQQ